ncbi:CPBP family intramembrane metalloprotease, partial [Halorubrum distributum]
MVDLPSTLEATVPNQLNDETGVASAVAFLALTIPITVVLNLSASLAAVSAVGSDAG